MERINILQVTETIFSTDVEINKDKKESFLGLGEILWHFGNSCFEVNPLGQLVDSNQIDQVEKEIKGFGVIAGIDIENLREYKVSNITK